MARTPAESPKGHQRALAREAMSLGEQSSARRASTSLRDMRTSAQTVDEAALGRLRDAIAAEDVDEEEQLKGVLRMLGAEIPDETQLPLFGKRPGGAR